MKKNLQNKKILIMALKIKFVEINYSVGLYSGRTSLNKAYGKTG